METYLAHHVYAESIFFTIRDVKSIGHDKFAD
nr:MAG TPA: hypothetical protein [Caudoviricetes sp.]